MTSELRITGDENGLKENVEVIDICELEIDGGNIVMRDGYNNPVILKLSHEHLGALSNLYEVGLK